VSMSPPPAARSKVGDVWVDPFDAHRYVFTGENLDKPMWGWVQWDLRNEQYEYERGDDYMKEQAK
jgi:hypothetical protein